MLSDEDKVRIREEEEIKMDVRKNTLEKCCCHNGRFCSKHCWIKAAGIVVLIGIVLVICCHHGERYHHTHVYPGADTQVITE